MVTGKFVGFVLVVCATLIESFGQLCLKNSAMSICGKWHKSAWLTAGVSSMAVESIVYTKVLGILDVSVAYPMGSLSFVFVTLMSWLFLKEKVARERWFGVTLIIGGTVLLGLSH